MELSNGELKANFRDTSDIVRPRDRLMDLEDFMSPDAKVQHRMRVPIIPGNVAYVGLYYHGIA